MVASKQTYLHERDQLICNNCGRRKKKNSFTLRDTNCKARILQEESEVLIETLSDVTYSNLADILVAFRILTLSSSRV